MARIIVHVEGQTEESFVKDILAPHLYNFGFDKVSPRLLGNPRARLFRGGIKSWESVRKEIINHLKEDAGSFSTTMVDYYALPNNWPQKLESKQLPFLQKSPIIENALLNDITSQMGNGFNPKRFIPYIIMHEFEGLLFSDCNLFSQGIYKPELLNDFQSIRNQFATPEEINDSPETAPSKRVEALYPGYQKPLLGTLAILNIGLATIRNQCPFFNNWICRLENSR